jgi:Mlc titration factor MtfA (ptsG expression regulator)
MIWLLNEPFPLTGEDLLLFVLFLAVILVQVLRLFANNSNNPYAKKYLNRYRFLRNLDPVYRYHIQTWFRFYNALDNKGKQLFERRVQRFIDMKQFIARGGTAEVTNEMKAMIAGCAVQITYGYPSVYFSHFWRILVYPGNYYSAISRRYHKGDVNPGGIIALSWRSFMEGFEKSNDGRNLGLHEMAHALRLINIVNNDEYNFYDRETMRKFDECAEGEIEKIRNSSNGETFFRDYGATNKEEFFAVAVESFFERAQEFKDYNPELYSLLCSILRIDTVSVYNMESTQLRA